jgi:hypothetical protein
MSAAALIFAFQILSLLGSVLTAVKLRNSGLYRKYRVFFWYFVFRIPNTVWPLFFDSNARNSKLYFVLWVATEPITWIFHTAVVFELYRLVLEKHKGLYTLGRWVMFLGIGTSVGISIVSIIPRLNATLIKAVTEQSLTMFWYLAMERGVMLGLAIFLLVMMAFLVLYTVPISGNVKIHARIYTIFFISNFLAFLGRSLLGVTAGPKTNTIAAGISAACVFAWLFLLNPKGEEVNTSSPILSPEHERRVLSQLDALNDVLLKTSKQKISR